MPQSLRAFLIFVVLLLSGCSQNATLPEKEASGPNRIAAKHLPNPIQVHAKVISGGLPEGDAAFAELQSLGVKTIISVDGQKPDIATAGQYGMKYVHLPHGYDGISEERVKELAKAVHDLPGPIYIHCHHGKHRSPAAASVACISAGLLPKSQGLLVLELAGTSKNYRGLFQSAENAIPFETALLDQMQVEFRETMEIPPLAEAMVELGHTHAHLNALAAADWKTSLQHPDLEPAHQALLLREHFTEMLRSDELHQFPADYQHLLKDSETAAHELENELLAWKVSRQKGAPPANLKQLTERISQNCKHCHEKYRDVPLSEK